MSDAIKHECGIALIRLRKSFSYYCQKYGTPFYGLSKLYVMMDKQQNRGQDGAGVAVIKVDTPPGYRYISRYRSVEPSATQSIFEKINKRYKKTIKGNKEKSRDPEWLKRNVPFMGEVLLGHLRYGTHGMNSIENCHPFLRQNNWKSRNLVMAGNFNMTNNDELFARLIDLGQSPKEMTDTVTVMEKIGHFLDEENQILFNRFKEKYSNREISGLIEETLDLQRVLRRSCKDFDGGYAMAGITGYGGSFVARDPNGIRPAYFYADDEVVVVASERPAIRIAFGVDNDQIQEIKPGHALIINKDGDFDQYPFIEQGKPFKCSFERVYFSRGSDTEIYKERKMLGELLVPQILESVQHDIENSIFSYIPNTAEVAYLGMMEGVEKYLSDFRLKEIQKRPNDVAHLTRTLNIKPRIEKLVIKDAKLRTFITNDDNRDSMVSMVYDSTYNLVNKDVDNLIVIDDSIVRGTTLEKSILRILDKNKPKRIVIVSSAPQIRYPDCYGIDMSKIKEFVAFRAMMSLLKEHGKEYMLDEVYDRCKLALEKDEADKENFVKILYDQFTYDEVSNKIAEIITPKDLHAEVKVVFQTPENLNKACPQNLGDWYFTGNYPTPGGYKVVNKAFVYFMEGKGVRAY